MSSTYAGVAVYPTSITIPSDGDDATAASANVPFQGLADRTAFLYSVLSIAMPLLGGNGIQFIHSVTSIANLRGYTPGGTSDEVCLVEGKGFYRFDNASTATDDGDLIVKPTAIGGGSPGRWLRSEYPRAPITITAFTGSGTYTPPANVSTVLLIGCGGGGAGAGGQQGSVGAANTYGIGGAGGGGARLWMTQVAVTPLSGVVVTIPAAATAGAADVAGGGNGAGADGGTVTFGALANFKGGAGGQRFASNAVWGTSANFKAPGGADVAPMVLAGTSALTGTGFAIDLTSRLERVDPQMGGHGGSGTTAGTNGGPSPQGFTGGTGGAGGSPDVGTERCGGGGGGGGAGPFGNGGNGGVGGNAAAGAGATAGTTSGTTPAANSGAGGGGGGAGGAGGGSQGNGAAGQAGGTGVLYVVHVN